MIGRKGYEKFGILNVVFRLARKRRRSVHLGVSYSQVYKNGCRVVISMYKWMVFRSASEEQQWFMFRELLGGWVDTTRFNDGLTRYVVLPTPLFLASDLEKRHQKEQNGVDQRHAQESRLKHG